MDSLIDKESGAIPGSFIFCVDLDLFFSIFLNIYILK